MEAKARGMVFNSSDANSEKLQNEVQGMVKQTLSDISKALDKNCLEAINVVQNEMGKATNSSKGYKI